jgi:hypothetical protein
MVGNHGIRYDTVAALIGASLLVSQCIVRPSYCSKRPLILLLGFFHSDPERPVAARCAAWWLVSMSSRSGAFWDGCH